jgi:excisionase family DNA binding protein
MPQSSHISPELLTPEDVARLLRVSKRTLQDMVKRGNFPPPRRLTPKTVRWPRAIVEEAAGLQPKSGAA